MLTDAAPVKIKVTTVFHEQKRKELPHLLKEGIEFLLVRLKEFYFCQQIPTSTVNQSHSTNENTEYHHFIF